MIPKSIYMDNAASTMISNAVKNTLLESLDVYGNPSSIHKQGEEAYNLIHLSSEKIANKLHCDLHELHYTSGATMSNSIFIHGFMSAHPDAKLIISAIEHNDIMMIGKHYNAYIVPVDHEGYLDLTYLNNILNELGRHTILCSIQMANGECGVIQDFKSISDIVHKYKNAYLHTDATQYIPYYSINIKELNIDALSMSGQKINCIKGIGLLYIKDSIKINPIIYGEQGLIGGTENVLGIACLGTAFDNLNYDIKYIQSVRDYFISNVYSENIIGSIKDRLPNNIYIKCNVDSESIVVYLNEFGISISAGSACSFNGNEPSHVALALGYSKKDANRCIRFTINKETTFEDIDYVLNIFNRLNKEDKNETC